MSPNAPPDEMREWIAGHLDPLDGEPASTVASDFDLGPNAFPNEPVSLKPAAVLVGLIERPHGYSVLLTRRADTLRSHTGQIALPGGRTDPGETSPVTALREAHEEVGLEAAQTTALGYLDPLLTITGFRVVPLLAMIQPEFVPRPDPGEVAEVFEVPLDLLLDPSRLERIELQFGGRPRHVLQYRYEQQRIWGVTASILFNLRERLAPATPGRI